MTSALKIAAVISALVVWPFEAIARRISRRPPSPENDGQEPERRSRLQESGAKNWLAVIAVFVALLGILGFLVVISGVIPIKASSGHWPITAWFLEFSMGRSVATHSLGIEVPPLNERHVRRAAGHYETACRPCHGSPGAPHPGLVRFMTPPPPYLPPVISGWKPNELFYIVKHGVKFTGMPGWPAQQRDDEVWAMVAFLLQLPKLDPPDYQRLVNGGVRDTYEISSTLVQNCERCHGFEGKGTGAGETPKLAGQREAYIIGSLRAFAQGERHSGIMEPVAQKLAAQDIRELASHYSGLPSADAAAAIDTHAESLERGQEIVQRGVPAQGVPSCVPCHGPGAGARNPAYPVLAGQHSDYLVLQLELFKELKRGGSGYAHLMHHIAPRLNPSQMRDVALYYSSLNASVGESAR